MGQSEGIQRVKNIVTCWVCHATNNFTWVSDLANLYWTFALTHRTIITVCSITITASTISWPILDCFQRRPFEDRLQRGLSQDCLLRMHYLLISAAVATY
jgi:hypothetical protein